MMRGIGMVIQFMGVSVVVGGIAFGVLTLTGSGLSLIVGGVTSGLLMIGFGNVVTAVAEIAADTKRSANALDRLAKAQTGVASELPADAAKRIKQSSIKPLSKQE